MAIPKGPVKAGKIQKAKLVQEGQVKKKKRDAKFKQTPQGKVPLIHNKNGNADSVQKKTGNQVHQQQQQKSPKNANKKKNKQSPKGKSPANQQGQNKKNKGAKKDDDEDEEDDSDADINEGISMTESMMAEDDDDDDEEEDEESSDNEDGNKSAPNIFGESLNDDTDEDDDEFGGDSDDDGEETPGEKKGVKMFKGTKSDKNEEVAEEDDDDDNDDEDENDLDDDDDDEGENDLDDDEEEDEDEEDEDFDIMKATKKAAKQVSDDDEDEEDDEEDDDDDDNDDDDDDDDGPGLKALIGNSLLDDDDDEDFEGKEDEDDDDDEMDSEEDEEEDPNNSSIQSNNSTTSSENLLSAENKAERDKRTIYIGNVSKDTKEGTIRAEFSKFGPIESLRVRGIIPPSPKMSYKVAAIKKKFHPKSKTVIVYIVYKSEESVDKALDMNGKQLEGNYLRVDRVGQQPSRDPKKTVFVANLPFDVEDNELWELFKKCGNIEYVRTIRDRKTGSCKGIGYINFSSEDSMILALDLNGSKLQKRDIRVSRYIENKTSKAPGAGGGQKRGYKQKNNSPAKKAKTDGADNDNSPKKIINKKDKKAKSPHQQSDKSEDSFQGQTANLKKKNKNKSNKFEKKKKAMAGKLLSKLKKPQ